LIGGGGKWVDRRTRGRRGETKKKREREGHANACSYLPPLLKRKEQAAATPQSSQATVVRAKE
jgi:hypothetical protein